MTSDQIINRLGTRRRELGLTYEQVGERAGMHLQHVWAVLNRKHEPGLATLLRLVEALELRVEIGDRP